MRTILMWRSMIGRYIYDITSKLLSEFRSCFVILYFYFTILCLVHFLEFIGILCTFIHARPHQSYFTHNPLYCSFHLYTWYGELHWLYLLTPVIPARCINVKNSVKKLCTSMYFISFLCKKDGVVYLY